MIQIMLNNSGGERERPRIRYTLSRPRPLGLIAGGLLIAGAVLSAGILTRRDNTINPTPGAFPTPTINPDQAVRIPLVIYDEYGNPSGYVLVERHASDIP